MDPVGLNVIEKAALGRPFQLGMLYDCRKDALIPGLRLWTKEQIGQNTSGHSQINTVFTVTASDSLTEKSKVLNIDGGVKLSVLGGLIDVSGAARYLKDTKKSFSQQRLTLIYHSTSKFEELTINHLTSGDLLHYDDDVATHVVTAVLYGADACFVFDREVSSDEDKKKVDGEVKVALKHLKGISVGAKIDLNDDHKTALQKFSCTFYGDFQLASNPTTFEDAVKIFKDLPNLLGENKELVVPLRVWLYPLDKLYSKAVKFQHDISINLITDLESVIESLSTTEMKCSDLLTDSPALTFLEFHDKINDMKLNCYKYKLNLMKDLGSLLPKLRGKFLEDTALIHLLREHEKSPFNRNALEQWMKEKEEESGVIKILLTQLKDSGATVEVNLKKMMMDLEVEHLVSYTFTSLGLSDNLLSKQKANLRFETKRKNDDSKHKTWLTSDIQMIMRNNLKMFKNLIDLTDCESTKFFVTSKEMEEYPGSCILHYRNGCDEGVCFTPPLKPNCPIIEEIGNDQMVLKVSPSCPATVKMKLLYKIKKENDWTSQPVLKNQHTVTLTDLRSETEYEIKCAAVGKLNYTLESDVMRVIIQGEKTSLGHTLYNIDELINKSTVIEYGNPVRYHLKSATDNLDQSKSYRKITFGERDTNKPHKIILMVGETGTGKTTLINTMINYICGVQRKHKVWIEITDEQTDQSSPHSQTSDVTVYGVYIQETSVDLTIIDTPGYGDTSDDKKIAESLLCLCTSEDTVHEINAVCLVVNTHQNQLTVKQQYTFDAVQSLFGKDIAEKIVFLFTHSTGARPKNALTVIKEAKVKCAVDEKKNQPIYFLFNNCQEETFDEEYQTFEDQSWDLSFRGMTEFFKFLDVTQPKTLSLTHDVLLKRKRLEANISKLQSCVEMTELKQKKLKQTQDVLEKHKHYVKENNQFESEVEVAYKRKVDIDPTIAKEAVCCTVCEENCYYSDFWWVKDLSWCTVMKNYHCTVCTNKCHHSKHVRGAKMYVTMLKVETRTDESLMNEYKNIIGEDESFIKQLQKDLQELEKKKMHLVNEAFHCVESLQMITLNPDSLFTLQHIDFLIGMFKEINEPEKAEALENIKKKAGEGKKEVIEYIKNISQGNK